MRASWRIKLEPIVTPVFRVYWRFARGVTLGVRGIAVNEHGQVMLIRHTYMSGWYLPGGGVEHAETAHAAVEREMAEEAGLEVTRPPRLLGFYSNHARHKNDHVALFMIDAWRHCAPLENGEIAERSFFALDALPQDITGGTRRRLAEVFEGADISPDW